MYIILGDLVLKVNGEQLCNKSHNSASLQKLLSASRGKITLAILPLQTNRSQKSQQHSRRRNKELYSKVCMHY